MVTIRALSVAVVLVLLAACGASTPPAAGPSRSGAAAVAPGQVQYEIGAERSPQLWQVAAGDPSSGHQVATWPGGSNNFARSPDGQLLATATQTGADVLDVDGSHRRAVISLAAGTGLAGPPTWSPDSRWLALPVQPLAVIVASVDGTHQRTVALGGSQPQWAPDSTHLAYTGPKRALFQSSADGTGSPVLLAPTGAYPLWSPEGSRLAYNDNLTLVLAAAHGSGPGRVGLGELLAGAAWSPDSRQLAFTAEGTLTVVHADGMERHALISPAQAGSAGMCTPPAGGRCTVPLGCPAWTTPSRLVFQAGIELREVSTDGTGVSRLARSPESDPGIGCPFVLPPGS